MRVSKRLDERAKPGMLKPVRIGLVMAMLGLLQACGAGAAREAEMAAAESARIAAEQEAAQLAAAQERSRAAEAERQRQARLAEQARVAAEQARQAEQARIEAEQARQLQAEQARRDALVQAQAERDEKLARVEQLLDQIAQMESQIAAGDVANARFREAIAVAEELIQVLALEQTKYDNVDANGNTLEPLAKERIQELQARKDSLVQAAGAAIP